MEIVYFSTGDKIGFIKEDGAIVFDPRTKVVSRCLSYGFIPSPDHVSVVLAQVETTPQEIMEVVDKWFASQPRT